MCNKPVEIFNEKGEVDKLVEWCLSLGSDWLDCPMLCILHMGLANIPDYTLSKELKSGVMHAFFCYLKLLL